MKTVMSDESAPAVSVLPLQWLQRYGDRLYAYALRRVRRPEVAEDLVQETLLAALEARDRFAHRAEVGTWLTGILKHKIADHLRARYRNAPVPMDAQEDSECFNRRGKWKVAVPQWKGDPHHLAEQLEFRAVLDSCMSKLPGRMAHLFISRVNRDSEMDELCDQLVITRENAWMLLHRARSRLRQCLTAHWFAPATQASTRRR
jgi:RNA polymerase sigma-70 factor (ECF subfamily)